MRSCSKKYYWIILLLLAACKTPADVEIIPVESFFATASQYNYRISPNGKNLAFLKNYNGKVNVFVRTVDDTTSLRLTSFTDVSVRSLNWVGDDRLFCEKEQDSTKTFNAFLIGKNGNSYVEVNAMPGAKINILNNTVHHGSQILITSNDKNQSLFDVYQLNIETGNKRLFVKNPGNIFLWFADNTGNVNLGLGGDGVNETIYFRKNNQDAFKAVISNNFKSTLQPLAFTKNKRFIYALSNLNRDKLALVEFDLFTGKEAKLIYQNPQADISEVFSAGADAVPVAITYELAKRQTHLLDKKYQSIYDDITKKLPNREIQIIDKDTLAQHLILKTYTDKNPGAYFIYDINKKSLTKLSAINNKINPDEMCEMKPISYKSTDGLTIYGYLTLPQNSKGENLPCVVMPHSGPSIRNNWGFSAEVQFLANQGYAVLQMNYRGSAGYGKAFQTAGFKNWGTKMQDDIYYGVKWLIKERIADPKKVAIFGYGFGGYSALNQAIMYPTTYKCAASYSGYINLFTYIKGFPAYFKPYKLMLNEIIGNPEADIEYLKRSSPVFQVDKIKTPILIAQGGKDAKVNVNETNQFVKELRKRKISVEYILNENETQLFKDPEHKLALYKQLGAFLDKHLKTQ
ncbi:MAG TPA: S9 family peptidase [Pelobium sp.]